MLVKVRLIGVGDALAEYGVHEGDEVVGETPTKESVAKALSYEDLSTCGLTEEDILFHMVRDNVIICYFCRKEKGGKKIKSKYQKEEAFIFKPNRYEILEIIS
nr:MAG TPA: protein of unknown function (DUF1967) [Caudoviricetes sp.]